MISQLVHEGKKRRYLLGMHPYGAFGAWQRGRAMQDGTEAPPPPFAAGSAHPTGRRVDGDSKSGHLE